MKRKEIHYALMKKYGSIRNIEQELCMDHTTLSDFLYCRRKTQYRTLEKIAEAIGININEVEDE